MACGVYQTQSLFSNQDSNVFATYIVFFFHLIERIINADKRSILSLLS